MYQKDYGTLKDRWLSYWERENHDKPLLCFTAPREGAAYMDLPKHASLRDRWFDTDHAVSRARRNIENTYYGGDAFPYAYANLGPDILGAVCGCELEYGESTSWAVHHVHDWGALPLITFDPNNAWFAKIQEMTRALLEDSGGDYLVGVTDLHPGMDALVSLRGPEALCTDLLDSPECIAPRIGQVFEVYKGFLNAQNDLIAAKQEGSTNWMGIWHPGKNWYVTSCDFSALISGYHFEDHVMPGLKYEHDLLPASIYHLDGPGALRHLDRLLQIPNLNGIQWVPGAGAPPAREWIRVYKKIQAAGKLIVAYCEPDDIAPVCEALAPEGLQLSCHAASESHAGELLKLAESIYEGKRRKVWA